MRRCLYIDHEYHKKTNSTRFLEDILNSKYELTYCYVDRHHVRDLPIESSARDYCYDLVVCFQLLPERLALNDLKFKRGVIVPMFDGMLPFEDPIWADYRDFKILNFSKTLHEKFLRHGFDSKYVQFFPKPIPVKTFGSVNKAFFWERTNSLPASKVCGLLKNSDITHLHIHRVPDPDQKIRKFKNKNNLVITESEWFKDKEDLNQVIQSAAFYFAPRLYEGIGQSFLGAMAMGRCVIAPDFPTANEYITDGYNGILYSELDTKIKHLDDVRKIQQNAIESVKVGYNRWIKERQELESWFDAATNIKLNLVYDATILLNLKVPGASRTGIFFVALNIVKELVKRGTYLVSFYIQDSNKQQLIEVLSDLFGHSDFRIYTDDSDFSDCDLFFSPIFKIPSVVRKCESIKKVYVLHDCIPKIFGGEYGQRQQWWFDMFDDIQTNDVCLAVSENTKLDFLRYKNNLLDRNICVIRLGASSNFKKCTNLNKLNEIRCKYNIGNNRYILSLCSLEPRKNLGVSIEAFLQFVKSRGIDNLKYVLVGTKWDGFDQEFERIVPSDSDRELFIFTGYIPDEDLPYLYSGADFFVYTSKYEGFGLPVLEAMKCGLPVITSNVSSLPEVAGNAALYVRPDSVDEHIKTFEKFYTSQKLRDEYSEKGRVQSNNFTWEKCVDDIEDVLTSMEPKKYPKISVVTATFNLVKSGRVESFRRCVNSVLHQVYPGEIEHIIIDGDSKDGTVEIIEDFFKKGLISLYQSEPDRGVYDAMNKGLSISTGEYITFLNSDDFYHDNFGLFKAIRTMLMSGSDYCYGDAVVQDVKSGLKQIWFGSLTNLPFASHYCHQTQIVRSSVLRMLGGFDISYKISADSDIAIRLESQGYKSSHVSYRYVTYFIGEGLSSIQRNQAMEDHAGSFYKHFGINAGLSLKQCRDIWQALGIHNMSRAEKIQVASHLLRPDWIAKFVDLILLPELGTNDAGDKLSIWLRLRLKIKTKLQSKRQEIRYYAYRYCPSSLFNYGKKIYMKLVR